MTAEQLKLHVPDAQLWSELERFRKSLAGFETSFRDLVGRIEADVVAQTGLRRGYGVGVPGPGPEDAYLIWTFAFGPIDYALASLAGRAPGPWFSQIVPGNWQSSPDACKLLAGWQKPLSEVAVGPCEVLSNVRRIQSRLCDRLTRVESPKNEAASAPMAGLRRSWSEYRQLASNQAALAASLCEITADQLKSGPRCPGCPAASAD